MRAARRGTFAALADPRGDRASAVGSASPRSSCCRCTPSCRTASWSQQGPAQLLGLQHAGLLRARAALPVGRHRARRVARWRCAGCTPPASRCILDVVYNHTAEGSELGPTLSFRGLDNASYYRLRAGRPRHCINDTGCGNTLNLSHPRVLQMVMDSLRYWVDRIPRRRLPLRPRHRSLGREAHGFDPGSGFFDAMRQDPVLSRVKLISEPWDIGPGGYQLGNHPPGFAEWNDRFRDGVRRFWRGDAAACGRSSRARLPGSADLFDRRRRRPWAIVNFVASHDGYTLNDLVSYDDKHNEANGEDNRDGHGDNHSRNWGVEGPTDDPAIRATRRAVLRAMLVTAVASAGHADAAGGRRVRPHPGRQQQRLLPGQRDQLGRLDAWPRRRRPRRCDASPRGSSRCASACRRCARATFVHGQTELRPGLNDISWFDQHGRPMTPEAWNDPEARTLALRRAAAAEAGGVDVTLLLLNADSAGHAFALPKPMLDWRLMLDSFHPDAAERPVLDEAVPVAPRGAVLLAAGWHDRLRAGDPLGRDAAGAAGRADADPFPPLGAGCASGWLEVAQHAPQDDEPAGRRLARGGGAVRRRRAVPLPRLGRPGGARPRLAPPGGRRARRLGRGRSPCLSLAACRLARPALARDRAVRICMPARWAASPACRRRCRGCRRSASPRSS